MLQGCHMAPSQIHDVDVVPYPRAVRGRVVVAEDIETLATSHCHLANVWHEIVWDPRGILADQAAFMGADGLKYRKRAIRQDGSAT